jgi:hypothetical protein
MEPARSSGSAGGVAAGATRPQRGEKLFLAFMVNARKPLTYFLDIAFDAETRAKYAEYVFGEYTYVDDYVEPPGSSILLERHAKSAERRGEMFRCRIWGVSKASQRESGLAPAEYLNLSNQAKMRIVDRLNPCDGWVWCSVDRVDQHRRLIVKLYDYQTKQLINPTLLAPEFKRLFGVYRPAPRVKGPAGLLSALRSGGRSRSKPNAKADLPQGRGTIAFPSATSSVRAKDSAVASGGARRPEKPQPSRTVCASGSVAVVGDGWS